jgi:hypothetical protein
MLSATKIAQIVHQANRGYQTVVPDVTVPVAPEWDLLKGDERKVIISGVQFAIDNPDVTPEESHENWLRDKEAEGWTYGPVKDVEAKTHPCMVPYADLPESQQVKDHLFLAIVKALS